MKLLSVFFRNGNEYDVGNVSLEELKAVVNKKCTLVNIQELLHDKDEITKKMQENGARSISKERSFTGIPHDMKPARFNSFTFCRYWFVRSLNVSSF